MLVDIYKIMLVKLLLWFLKHRRAGGQNEVELNFKVKQMNAWCTSVGLNFNVKQMIAFCSNIMRDKFISRLKAQTLRTLLW